MRWLFIPNTKHKDISLLNLSFRFISQVFGGDFARIFVIFTEEKGLVPFSRKKKGKDRERSLKIWEINPKLRLLNIFEQILLIVVKLQSGVLTRNYPRKLSKRLGEFAPLFFMFAITFFCLPLFATVVSSDAARYDGETIILKGHVHLEHEMGELFANLATLKRDEAKTTRLDFPWIKLEQDVHFRLPKERELFCPFASCDYTQMRANIEGGLHYRDPHGELYAKRGVVEYIEENKRLKPTKVTLIGDVQMRSLKHAQYALADLVEYFPDEELMILTAKKRVLFYDEGRGLELAAHEVRAKRDADGHESVQGVGDVRFVFNADELEQIKKIDAKN